MTGGLIDAVGGRNTPGHSDVSTKSDSVNTAVFKVFGKVNLLKCCIKEEMLGFNPYTVKLLNHL